MRRRRLLGFVGSLPLAGCTGGPGDPITSLAVNRSDAPHTVSVRVVRDGRGVIEEAFQSTEPFNQLDVVIGADGAVELNRGRAA